MTAQLLRAVIPAVAMCGAAHAWQAQPTPLDPTEWARDGWSAPARWRTPDDWYTTAVHATLMPSGDVLFIGYSRPTEEHVAGGPQRRAAFSFTPTALGAPVPGDVTDEDLVPPYDYNETFFDPVLVSDDLFCSGHTLLADGSFFSAGGTRAILDTSSGDIVVTGLQYATRYAGLAGWTRLPNDMQENGFLREALRWYPTCTRLPDGRVLVTSGYEVVFPQPYLNLSAEVYDPSAGTWQTLSGFGETPAEIFNSDYTHAFVLPQPVGGYDLLMFGHVAQPVLSSTTGSRPWHVRAEKRPGTEPETAPNHGASTLLLPIRVQDFEWGYHNGSVLMAGGTHMSTHMRHADVYDPVADAWSARIPIRSVRHHPSTVLLPDGQVLVVAGHNMIGDASVLRATLIDPASSFRVRTGTTAVGEVRGYHTVSVLLPDGRVLVGGGRDSVTTESGEKVSFRYYYPPYMFRPRPTIESAPTTLSWGGSFTLLTRGAPVEEVVLMALPSMTHSFDANQRSIQLPVELTSSDAGGHVTVSRAPEDARVAPPGDYMLFVLDRRRVPSEARFVRLE